MKHLRRWHAVLAICLGMGLTAGCGGGGGSGSSSAPPADASRDLQVTAANLPDQSQAVPTGAEFLFTFDADVAPADALAFVQISDGQVAVPVVVDTLVGSLRIRPVQPLTIRTAYTLTLKAGLKARNGAVLRSDVVRRFNTVLLNIVSQIFRPGNHGLTTYPGQHTFRIGDVNSDGRPDIVQIGGDAALIGELNSFAVNVFLQNADHSFTLAQNLLIHEALHSGANAMGDIGVVDLDHDGVPEIVISIQRPLPGLNGLMVLKQDAQGRYATGDFIATDFAYTLFIADIDRDSKPDVLGIGQGMALTDGPDRCGMVAILSSAGGARLQSPTVLPCLFYEAVLGPLERPDQLNLLLLRPSYTQPAEPFQPRLNIYDLNAQGQPTLNPGLMAAATSVCSGMLNCKGPMLLDANGDGIQELLFRSAMLADRTDTTVIYTRGSQGAYVEFARPSFGAHAFMVADMDGNGLDDVVSVVQALGPTYLAAGFSRPTPGLELSHLIPAPSVDTMEQATVGVADLDGDGLPDVVLDSYNIGLLVLFQRRQ